MKFLRRRLVPALLTAAIFRATGVSAAISAETRAPITLQSLVGDWESAVYPTVKLTLHVRVDASGQLTGTFDTPDTPPKHVELTNFKLRGTLLSYTMSSHPGTVYEVISADGTKMQGPFMWTKAGSTRPPLLVPPFVTLSQIAGDWASGDGPSAQILRLRLDAGGALAGSIDTPEPISLRLLLSNVRVSGRTLTFTMPDGRNSFEGNFSGDGKTVAATGNSTIEATWQHVRTLAQAEAREAADRSNPANGDWRGVTDYTADIPGVGPSKGTATITLRFRSNPASCAFNLTGTENPSDQIPCQMTATGTTVHVSKVIGYDATFLGNISADGNHLIGTFTMGPVFHWTAPVQIDFQRIAPTP
jgi:hypothetical protein